MWRQIQADVTNRPHCTISVDEGPALGVALLAGVGTGVWASVPEACEATMQVVDSREPCAEAHRVYAAYHGLYRRLYAQLASSFADVQELIDETS